jgi:hypothetical protein
MNQHQKQHVMNLSFSIFFPQKKKHHKPLFMMLEVRKTNSRIMNFISVKLPKKFEIPLCAFNSKKWG